MPVTGDTIVTLADGSRTAVCDLQPGMELAYGSSIRTITVQRFTGWLYMVEPHFITTGSTRIGANKQMAKDIATKRIYVTDTNIYDFIWDLYPRNIFTCDTNNTQSFWSDMTFSMAQKKIEHLPDIKEVDPASKVYHRTWDADSKTWTYELADYTLN
jgi:hypothetical protein